MPRNNYFEIDIEKQKNKYWIFKELQNKQVAVVEDVNNKEWWQGLSRELGIESKRVTIDGEKVLHSPITNRYSHEGFIIRKENIQLEEIKKGIISRFIPKRLGEK